MDMEYTSTATQAGNAIDSRCLSLAIEFYSFSKEQTYSFCEDILLWISELFDDKFVCKRTVGGKSTTPSQALAKLNDSLNKRTGWSYIHEAFYYSSVVHNSKTLNSHLKSVQRGIFLSNKWLPTVSIDYPTFWTELFPYGRGSNDNTKQKILNLFMENRRIITGYHLADVQALLTICPYESQETLFYGDFKIDCSAFCLGHHIQDMANTFVNYVKCLSERYTNLNARVMLQPVVSGSPSPYLQYFGNRGSTDGSHIDVGYTEKEWYTTYYIPGVEWCNILSPLVQTHFHRSFVNSAKPNDITIEQLHNGSLFINSKKSIEQYDVFDSIALKQLVYPALYPGRSCIPMRGLFSEDISKFMFWTFPRSDWAIIPVLDNELDIIGSNLVFAYQSSKDSL